jgi:hypothetical protein
MSAVRQKQFWYLSVEVNLESQFVERLIEDIRQVSTL